MSYRRYWIDLLLKAATPVFSALARDELRRAMPVETTGAPENRALFTHLEAVGRSLAGIGPWLERTESSPAVEERRRELTGLVLAGLKNGADRDKRDYLNFCRGDQPVVDAAFLAQGLLRCWDSVWLRLEDHTRERLLDLFEASRSIKPYYCNWLLFSAMVEAFLCRAGRPWDRMRIDYALREHGNWYKGDGIYGDGPDFHWDYYNSFVIHPMICDILDSSPQIGSEWKDLAAPSRNRLARYALIQERLISPEGTYPPIGRSLAYRVGAFHALALAAAKDILPEGISPASVRCALTKVMKRQMEAPGTFDAGGWLTVGFAGHQPSLGEEYISTGSLYLCLTGFLPLGLPEDHPFWSGPEEPWTAVRAWSGEDIPCDHALAE